MLLKFPNRFQREFHLKWWKCHLKNKVNGAPILKNIIFQILVREGAKKTLIRTSDFSKKFFTLQNLEIFQILQFKLGCNFVNFGAQSLKSHRQNSDEGKENSRQNVEFSKISGTQKFSVCFFRVLGYLNGTFSKIRKLW